MVFMQNALFFYHIVVVKNLIVEVKKVNVEVKNLIVGVKNVSVEVKNLVVEVKKVNALVKNIIVGVKNNNVLVKNINTRIINKSDLVNKYVNKLFCILESCGYAAVGKNLSHAVCTSMYKRRL